MDKFNPKHADFDKALVDEVLDLQGGLVAQGYTPADALTKAARYVVGDAIDGEVEPAAPVEKKKTDVKAKVKIANAQPQNLSSGDSSSAAGDGVIDMDTITENEFDALPESKKKELRGDVLA